MSIESIKHHVKEEIEKVNQVLHLLEGGNQRAGKQATGVRKKRTLSAAGKAQNRSSSKGAVGQNPGREEAVSPFMELFLPP